MVRVADCSFAGERLTDGTCSTARQRISLALAVAADNLLMKPNLRASQPFCSMTL